jgi:hypothetical protein
MMAATILLDRAAWDLVLDANGNIALATEPYSLAQDAASAIKTIGPTSTTPGECYWDTTVGVPWLEILGLNQTPLALLKAQLVDAAETVPDVASAQVFITAVKNRTIQGQVQIVSASSGAAAVATFSTINPQGTG